MLSGRANEDAFYMLGMLLLWIMLDLYIPGVCLYGNEYVLLCYDMTFSVYNINVQVSLRSVHMNYHCWSIYVYSTWQPA